MKSKVAVAISGSGRSLENLILESEKRNFQISLVICSRPDAAGINFAKVNAIPLLIEDFSEKQSSSISRIESFLKKHEIDWIVLAGFLKKWPAFDNWSRRTINIHPALLPKFGGKGFYGSNVHQAVIDAGDGSSGATIHFVNSAYDEGKIIAQGVVDVEGHDTSDSLAKKVFEVEKKLYPRVLSMLIKGELPTEDIKIFREKDFL